MPLDINRVHKSIAPVDKFLKEAPKDPTPEKVHDLRTSTRRLESALEALKIAKKRTKKRLLQNLALLRKRSGKLRDMDVLTAHTMSIKPDHAEQECVVELLEHLGANRSKQAKKLRKTAAKVGSRLREDLESLSKKLKKLARKQRQKGNVNVSNSQKTSALTEFAAQLHSPAHLNKSNLHSYRVRVKELRYVLQLSEEAQADRFVSALGEVKDAIGEWHDWEELVAIASEVLEHGAQCKLVQQLKRTATQKFEKALSVTNKMRNTYFDGGRGNEKTRKDHKASLPVLVAKSPAGAKAHKA